MAFPATTQLLAALLIATAPTALSAQSVAQTEARARAGDVKAMVALGRLFEDQKAYGDAMRWYRAAADKGSAEGMRLLAEIYYEGKGVAKDFAEALKWNRAAAAKGNGRAIWNIGMAHLTGRGVPKSDANAILWYRKAATMGDAEGLNSLGVMASLGKGMPQDKVAALRYFERAADKGSNSALFNMSQLYQGVAGIPANLVAQDGLKAAWERQADPRQWRVYMTQSQSLKPASMVPRSAEPRRTPPDWVPVSGNEGEAREYDRAHVLVHRTRPGSRDYKGDPMGDSIQIVFRDGSSLNLDCANSKYSMWDTYKNENWGGAMSAMPLASRFGAQYCPIIRQLKCKPTFSSYDPPCDNQDY